MTIAREEGLIEGAMQAKLETAKKMLLKNVSKILQNLQVYLLKK